MTEDQQEALQSAINALEKDADFGVRGAAAGGLRVTFFDGQAIDRLTATGQVARWMTANGYATGHGDDVDDLLRHLVQEVRDQALRAALAETEVEPHELTCVCGRVWSISGGKEELAS